MAAAAEVQLTDPELLAGTYDALSPDAEFDLLVACCAQHPDPATLTALQSGVRWDHLLDLATRHGALPQVASVMSNHSNFPAAAQIAVRERTKNHVKKVLRFIGELKGILCKFDQCGITALPHKGPALAHSLFGDSAMRQFGDLDFLVRTQDIPRASAALQQLGYEQKLRLTSRQERAYLYTGYEHVFSCASGSNLVELQWQILPRFYAIDFDMNALFARSIAINFEGLSIRVLRNEDLMLVLCVHAAKHQWERLGMLRDIAALAQLDLDWRWIASEARRLKISRIVTISLLLGRNVLGYRLPFVSDDKKCQPLSQFYEARLRSGEYRNPERMRYFREMIALRESWSDRVRFVWRLATSPSVEDWKSVAIPDRMFFLYRGVRAVRLLKRGFRLK